MAAFDSNNVSQSDVTAERNVGGRDVYDNSTTNHFHQNQVVYREDRRLRALVEEHEREIRIDPAYKDFSEKLNDFLHRKVEGSLRDLSEKLTDGNREYLVVTAMELKEDITKKVMRNGHFETAQKIYTYLLAQMRITFQSEVASRIKSGDFANYQIDDIVKDRVIEPLLASVDDCSLMIDREELYGLLYILTGNCYIAWD